MSEKQRILIVDDKKDNLFALRAVLAGVDAEIVEATSGNEALSATLDHHFAMAILDVVMPGMSGYELAEHLRADEKTQAIPLVFLSGSHADEQQVFKGYEVGCIDYILKPYAPQVLLGKVKVFLELDRQREELRKDRDHIEALLADRSANLAERIKEITCLYSISSLVAGPCGSIEETLKAAVNLIPPGWLHPETARARIVFEGREFASPDFRETAWKQSADIVLDEETVGTVEVCYLEERPQLDEGRLLKEERSMLTDIAGQLGVMIAGMRARRSLAMRSRIAEIFLTMPDDEIYDEVLRIVLEVMESEFGVLGYIDGNGALVTPTMTGPIWDACNVADKAIVFPPEKWGNSTWGRAMREKKTIWSNDPSANTPEGHVAITRHIALPLVQRGEVVGLLMVANKETDYSKADVACMESIGQSIAPLLAVRVQRDRLDEARQRTQEQERLARQALELLNRSTDYWEAIRDILTLIKKSTGFESVGVRLRDGDDFPYYGIDVSREEFMDGERPLCKRNDEGEIVCGETGIPVMACMCGDILCGRTDPDLPFFTKGGTFWTNSATELLTSITEKHRYYRMRNRCKREGYESVALIPIRAGLEISGLLLLHDRRRGRFTPEAIDFFETLTAGIGTALARRESEVPYRTVFEGGAEGILVVDDGTRRFRLANPAICGMLGYTERELMRLGVADIHPKESLGQVLAAVEAQRSGEEPLAKGIPCLRKDGTVLYADIMTAAVEMGGRVHLVGFFTDVTEHRKLEDQFQRAQKLEAVGQLAGGVAHDFNNLLTVILGYGDSLLDSLREEDPLRNEVEEIVNAGQRASDLTRQLLAFSRRQILEPQVLDLNAAVKNIERMLRRLIGEHIEFTMALDEDLDRVKADGGQLEQVIVNLAVNARDAMPEGGNLIIETANVEIDQGYTGTHMSVVPGRYVMLAVTDTGCGMNEETMAKVFEPFFTTKEQGTGLGLSSVYGIVKQSGGNIWVYSEPGEGTTFKIYLPRTEDEPIAEAERAEEEELRGAGERVLVVEDEPAVRNLVERMLEKLGYRVTVAANGGEALLAVEEKGLKPDLVITDVVMPGMSGPVLVGRLRKTRLDMKVLYMSGYTDNAIVHHGILESGIPFIQKPFNSDDLARKIKKVLRPKG